MLKDFLNRLLWLGHSTFVYTGPPVVYFNPYDIHRIQPADLILVGHEHRHHCSPPDLERVRKSATIVIADQSAARKIDPPVIAMSPGEELTTSHGVTIEAVPAYNLETSYHPKSKGYLGFIATLAGVRVYHAGDTDFIPEMRRLKVDIALLPVSGLEVMTAEEAARAALALKPQVAIPMHYGPADPEIRPPQGVTEPSVEAEAFRALLAGKIRVEILARS
jgi:L-ascorbate metabolism protein UlaG (beta-lactamase superfamily)